MEGNNFDMDRIQSYIDRCKWTWATSMKGAPHEYIHRYHCELSDKEFVYIFHAQRTIGVHERWGKYNNQYLYLNGYKYWTMGDPLETTWILNRQKVFDEFDNIEKIEPYYTDHEAKFIISGINTLGFTNIFEMGVGDGRFTRLLNPDPSSYYAVDPSRKAIAQFRGFNPGLYRRCSTKSFEEMVERWDGQDYSFISLFGSASYVMPQYLEMIKNRRHFLMFYHEDYCPEQFRQMHHFRLTRLDLKRMFPKSNCQLFDNRYYCVYPGPAIDWQALKRPEPVQTKLEL